MQKDIVTELSGISTETHWRGQPGASLGTWQPSCNMNPGKMHPCEDRMSNAVSRSRPAKAQTQEPDWPVWGTQKSVGLSGKRGEWRGRQELDAGPHTGPRKVSEGLGALLDVEWKVTEAF